MLLRKIGLLMLLAGVMPAETIYRIEFTGVVTQGGAATKEMTGQAITQSLVEHRVSGKIDLLVDKLPVPTTGFQSGNPQSIYQTSLPSELWLVNFSMFFEGTTAFVNALPWDPSFQDLDQLPVPPGGTDRTAPVYDQGLTINPGLNFFSLIRKSDNNWSDPTVQFAHRRVALNLNVLNTPAFFDGTNLTSFSVPNAQGSGLFEFTDDRALRDSSQGVSGFVVSGTSQGLFSITSVSGTIVTPEPGSWLLAGAGMLLFVIRRR